ncbi:type III-B CRISPR module RAMP protein Cmr4 [Kutzneria sp. 744]|uniref:type III-B CRISPR module RAMP protein Cmr4 n=1 Tax=Kutzneria sp. (strain 744) TaxID=345341 RepID=UPI0003EEC6B4|nr:type III-B CRISPR module RAMP protein Cmr4 [Kutzneria sp. 744]EWM19875.1 CRISPR-associated RAMP protein, Cmr4 family [Kutzneria sp. 744]
MHRRLLLLLAESPVHAGGSEARGAVDLPIQREAGTGLPVIWGQSLKGALRQTARDAGWAEAECTAVFGSPPPRRDVPAAGTFPTGTAANDGVPAANPAPPRTPAAPMAPPSRVLTKGAVSVGDAQLLAFPVATLRNLYAWATGELLLSRLRRKLALLGVPDTATTVIGGPALADGAVAGASGWATSHAQVLGPFLATVTHEPAVRSLGAALANLTCPTSPVFEFTRTKMTSDLLVADHTTLGELTQTGTDVVARVQLYEKAKTVANGPFYSEHLPAETVLAAVLAGTSAELLDRLCTLVDNQPITLGGDETIGKGLLWCRVHTAATATTALTTDTEPTTTATPTATSSTAADTANAPAHPAPAPTRAMPAPPKPGPRPGAGAPQAGGGRRG